MYALEVGINILSSLVNFHLRHLKMIGFKTNIIKCIIINHLMLIVIS